MKTRTTLENVKTNKIDYTLNILLSKVIEVRGEIVIKQQKYFYEYYSTIYKYYSI